MEMDRTHIEESTQLRHKTSPHPEPPRQGQRRRGSPKNTLRREMETDLRSMNNNWIELERKAHGQSGLENANRQPMLHWG
ncbi:unnamed protein product [Schistosoma mattheei]|uniref:Uncharacterized protein n=1 Tax=Schistosoma mattheei TaxID=31246 RepID=A0A3P8GD81_9TREM|nr:unnamed protein product [Schistosoma mattheei]